MYIISFIFLQFTYNKNWDHSTTTWRWNHYH